MYLQLKTDLLVPELCYFGNVFLAMLAFAGDIVWGGRGVVGVWCSFVLLYVEFCDDSA